MFERQVVQASGVAVGAGGQLVAVGPGKQLIEPPSWGSAHVALELGEWARESTQEIQTWRRWWWPPLAVEVQQILHPFHVLEVALKAALETGVGAAMAFVALERPSGQALVALTRQRRQWMGGEPPLSQLGYPATPWHFREHTSNTYVSRCPVRRKPPR